MTIKGYASQGRITHTQNRENFASIVNTDPKNRAGLDVLPKALYKVDAVAKVAETVTASDFPSTVNAKLRIVKLTGHSFRKGDILRFSTGTNTGLEVPAETVTTDYIFLAGELLADPDGDSFFHTRHITLTISSTGDLATTPGPTQFILDSAATQVLEDTVTPANNLPLPVKLLDSRGDVVIDNLQRLDIVDQLDGTILDPSSTTIPASASLPLEIVASTAAAIKELQVIDDIGEFLGLYTGAASSEVFLCVLPQGYTGASLPVKIPAGTRLSIKNMKNATITTDTRLAINFLG